MGEAVDLSAQKWRLQNGLYELKHTALEDAAVGQVTLNTLQKGCSSGQRCNANSWCWEITNRCSLLIKQNHSETETEKDIQIQHLRFASHIWQDFADAVVRAARASPVDEWDLSCEARNTRTNHEKNIWH